MQNLQNDLSDTGKVFHEDAKDERYKRYKHLCYRNLLLKSALTFLFGFLLGHFLGLLLFP